MHNPETHNYEPKRRRVGGLRIDAQKRQSTHTAIAAPFVPAQLHVPVESHFGSTPQIIVTRGQSVLRNQVIAHGDTQLLVPDVHASSSGTVEDISACIVRTSSGDKEIPTVVIRTDGLDRAAAVPPPVHGVEDTAQRLERIRGSGIAGLGGAAVSTSWKLSRSNAYHTLIINGAECEPHISCDDMLMRENAAAIVAGGAAIADLLDVDRCIFAVERDKPQALDSLRKALQETGNKNLYLAELPAIYPAGGERQLIELLLGTEVPTGAFPADIGVICHNVGTAAAVHEALHSDTPLISRVVTLTGQGIAQPQNVRARIGTRIADLIAHFGGYAQPAALIVGGSMMGLAQRSDEIPIMRGTNCIYVPAEHEIPESHQAWPCIRCGECAAACPARLLPQEMLRASQSRDFTKLESLGLRDCIECGCCDAICPSHIQLTHTFVRDRRQLSQRAQAQAFSQTAHSRYASREQRLAQLDERERQAQDELRAGLRTAEDRKAAIAAALQRARGGTTPDAPDGKKDQNDS